MRPSPTPRPARVAIVGDALLDIDWAGDVERVCPDAPAPVVDQRDEHLRPGGAALAAVFAVVAGADVTLVTALGADAEGAALRGALADAGVAVIDLGLSGPTPVKLRVRSAGQSLLRVDRGCAPVLPPGPWTDAATDAVAGADAVLVSDYGRGMAALGSFADLVRTSSVPVVWDPHARGPVPPSGLDLLVPNGAEGRRLVGEHAADRPTVRGDDRDDDTRDDGAVLADRLAACFGCAVALTVGSQGAVVAGLGTAPVVVPVDPVIGDPCGAGDRFAATAVVARARGDEVLDAVRAAAAAARQHVLDGFDAVVPTAASDRRPGPAAVPRLVPGRGAAAHPRQVDGHADGRRPADCPSPRAATPLRPGTPLDAPALARQVRAAEGRVVVAGGCFDVLHAGHVRLLEAARRLGDCLIVCVNGDLSVRRLKGRHRPVNPIDDRVEVLRALSSVDAVHVFDEDDPRAALALLRPHIFVKGADHAGADLPERPVLDAWGGEIVFVPVVPGRSTTRVLEIAAGTAAS